jgi:hypothetical protein
MRLRFTIRDLLWLTAVVALALGWYLDRTGVARHDAESSRQASEFKSRWIALAELQNTLDGLIRRHTQLADSPINNQFELGRIERDIQRCETQIHELSEPGPN